MELDIPYSGRGEAARTENERVEQHQVGGEPEHAADAMFLVENCSTMVLQTPAEE